MIVVIIQLIGTLIPIAGIAALLLNKENNAAAIRLMTADIGCLIMNSGYFLMTISENAHQAETAAKMETAGNTLFYLFFVLFLAKYQHIEISKIFLALWTALECIYIGVFWVEPVRNRILGVFTFEHSKLLDTYTVHIEPKRLYLLRYSMICFILVLGVAVTTVRMFCTKLLSERKKLAILVGAQFVIAISFNIQLLVNPSINIVPIFASLSIIALIVSLMREEFFGVTHSGHEWVFEQMDNAYIIVDSLYGYLDSNNAARSLFTEIKGLRQNKRIPDTLYEIFASPSDECEINGRSYSRKVTEIKNKDSVVGYGLLLEDITEQREFVDLINNYNTQLEAEVKRQTEHIQTVQDSMITGIASVVESRDNSTGGHINRTSAVVKIFARKLLEHSELGLDERFLQNVSKAAPMHDLEKVAVDDVILRKPGRFTDEEYDKMKKHSAEGARVLGIVLEKVDDEDFVRIAINVAHYHHERYDGKGYPSGLSGEDIPIEARIMALADVFDALVSKRCYKEAYTYDKAFSIIEEGLGTQFDPQLGRVFAECREELENLYSNTQQ